MKTITINIAEGGNATCSETNLGRAGEHNNTMFHIFVTDEAMLGCDYFRCWFGNRYSGKLYLDYAQIMYDIPQDALIPPTVDFQLCGYKAEGSDPYIITRSSILTFNVDESACCTLLNDKPFEPYEIFSSDCSNAANSARKSENIAMQMARNAQEFASKAVQSAEKYEEFLNTLENKADTSYVDGRISEIDQRKANQSQVNSISNRVDNVLSQIDSKADKSSLASLATKQEVETKQNKLLGYYGQYLGFDELYSSQPKPMTPDSLPKDESDYLITSGAVHFALKAKADKTYVDEQIGEIGTLLDNIIAIQNQLIGGDVE